MNNLFRNIDEYIQWLASGNLLFAIVVTGLFMLAYIVSLGAWFKRYEKMTILNFIVGILSLAQLVSFYYAGTYYNDEDNAPTSSGNDTPMVEVGPQPRPPHENVPPIVSPPPRVADREFVSRVQIALAKKHCYFGPIDGTLNEGTIRSIDMFNKTNIESINPHNFRIDTLSILTGEYAFPCKKETVRPECFEFNGMIRCE